MVYTGIGALCWLPSVERWARTVAALLRPGGRLFLRDGHPMAMTLDEQQTDRLVVDHPYIETPEPMVWTGTSTYVETDGELQKATTTHEWNHGLGEIVTALLNAGLTLTGLVEHDSAPWEFLPGRMVRGDDGEFRLPERRDRVPFTFTVQAHKP
ncbi:hypothetical protein [Nocardia alni]|uniref:hypothetical protein n=1 Tax=Nocardia alni TaxID=2815723 RepID=UPI001C24DD9A|nr:hypothetical protein [Nocardia alni]